VTAAARSWQPRKCASAWIGARLIHGRLPKPSRVVLIGPRFEVQRLADGSYTIRGLGALKQDVQTDWHATLNGLLSQTAEIVVQDGQLTLYDSRHPGAAVFNHIGLKLDKRAGGSSPARRAHAARGPGAQARLRTAHPGQGRGLLHLGIGMHASPAPVYRPPSSSPICRRMNRVTWVPAWWIWMPRADSRQGQIQSASLSLDARNLVPAAPLGAGPALPLLQGRFAWARELSGWRLQVRDLKLQVGRAAAWGTDGIDLEFAQSSDGEHWSGDAGYLKLQDLTALTGMGAQVPGRQAHAAAALRPRGRTLQARPQAASLRQSK